MSRPATGRLAALAGDPRLRFLLAGGLASGIAWAARLPLGLLMPFPAAVALATALGMVVGFLLYRGFVFGGTPARGTELVRQIGRFVLVNLAGGVLTLLVAVAFRRLGVAALGEAAWIDAAAHAAGIAAGAVMNFAGHKLFTFRALP
jgi:energy-coupling factor transport system substrate-specific component